MPHRSRLLVIPAVVAAGALALAGCASPDAAPGDPELVQVVASTDVYGDIAATIGGEHVGVTSIIDSAAQDPHSYEASARDRLALDRADIVIENGGGYDPFIADMLAAGSSDPEVLTVVDIAGLDDGDTEDAHGDDHDHSHGEGANEHVWYDLHVADELAAELAAEFADLDPQNAADYRSAYADFHAAYQVLQERVQALAAAAAGRDYVLTEPVPAYLLDGTGLTNVTPDEFSEAIEEGSDVPPLVLRRVLDLVATGDPALLAYNSQTSGPETERVRAAAEDAGVTVVDFTETLPEGEHYLGWMTANLDQIEEALAR